MSNIPLTEGNLQSLQRSQQYGSNATPLGNNDSGLMTSGLHALLDSEGLLGGGVKDSSSAPYLTPEDATNIVNGLLQQYYHVQDWQVPWPRPKRSPLLYVPDAITDAFKVPKAPTMADLDAMSIGLLESIPLTHDLLFPESERQRAQQHREIEEQQAAINEKGLHAPYQTAKDRNPNLDDEDFALIDVDFCSSGHGQRHLPSITFLQRPSYTEIGLAPAERREEERRNAIGQSMTPALTQQLIGGGGGGNLSQISRAGTQLLMNANTTNGSMEPAATTSSQQQQHLSSWNMTASKTFKHAKMLDKLYDDWVEDASKLKLGLVTVPNSPLDDKAIKELTVRILNLVAFITANGVVLGAKRNGTNNSFYNTQQGKFVGAIVWRTLVSIAAEAWGQHVKPTTTAQRGEKKPAPPEPKLIVLPASTIVDRILDDADFDSLALGSAETKQHLHEVLEDVIRCYLIAVKQSVNGNKNLACPLNLTAEDFAVRSGLGTQVLPSIKHLVFADAVALEQRPPSQFEDEVETPLDIASNVNLQPTLTKISQAGETARRTKLRRNDDTSLPTDTDGFKVSSLERRNTAVPLSVMPVFPEGFEKIMADHTASAHTYDFANAYRGLHHVVLNGERNGFIPGAYVPLDVRSPNVLFNDRLHFKPIVDEAELVKQAMNPSSSSLSGSKRNRRGESIESTGETDAYTTGTTESKFEKYLADQSSTVSYVLKVHGKASSSSAAASVAEGGEETDNAAASSAVGGPYVTYARIPTLTRYKRAQVRITAEDVLKTVTVSWTANESEAKTEQLGLVVAGEGEENDNATAAADAE